MSLLCECPGCNKEYHAFQTRGKSKPADKRRKCDNGVKQKNSLYMRCSQCLCNTCHYEQGLEVCICDDLPVGSKEVPPPPPPPHGTRTGSKQQALAPMQPHWLQPPAPPHDTRIGSKQQALAPMQPHTMQPPAPPHDTRIGSKQQALAPMLALPDQTQPQPQDPAAACK